MQKKNLSTESVTKEELKKILKEYPTKTDLKKEIKKALQDYPTKDDLSERLTASQNAFRVEIDYKLKMMNEDIRTTMSTFTNRILTAIDPLLRELETRQQDREIAAAQMTDVHNRLDNHENRLQHLERT